MMKTRIAVALAVLVAAGCTPHNPASPPPPTTVAPTNTRSAAPASPTSTSVPPPKAELQPGPHSPLADVDLPAGVTFGGNSSLEERWSYSTSYDDTVAFLRKQFATGQKYDTRGATWWRGLPPCYNDMLHESPPGGWVMEDSTLWVWADASTSLSVEVFRPSSTITPHEIVIDNMHRDNALVCNRR
jgi:hypothetical protein